MILIFYRLSSSLFIAMRTKLVFCVFYHRKLICTIHQNATKAAVNLQLRQALVTLGADTGNRAICCVLSTGCCLLSAFCLPLSDLYSFLSVCRLSSAGCWIIYPPFSFICLQSLCPSSVYIPVISLQVLWM
jgi:hypothetical protein